MLQVTQFFTSAGKLPKSSAQTFGHKYVVSLEKVQVHNNWIVSWSVVQFLIIGYVCWRGVVLVALVVVVLLGVLVVLLVCGGVVLRL